MKDFNLGAIISRLFDNKKFLIALSLVSAFVFWLIIDITENPLRDVTVNDVSVKMADQNDDNGNILSVIGDYTDKVSVTVNGPGYIVSKISKDDVSVAVSSYADVTKPGTYVLTLTATTTQSGCTISRISPSYIKVVYDYDTSSEIPVEVDTTSFQQYVDVDCEIYRSGLRNNSDGAEISSLAVSGPSETISSIAKVVVKPKLPDGDIKSVTQNFDAELIFCDAMGNRVDVSGVTYNTDTYVRIIVYKTADVSLKPTFINLPEYFSASDEGLPPYKLTVYDELSRKTQTIDMVKIRGPVDVIDRLKLSGLQLSPINFLQVTPNNTSFNMSFILEDGVEVVDGTEEVTVSLNLGNLSTKSLRVSPSHVKFEGLNVGFSATSSYKKNINVVICGRYAVIKNISAEDISVTVNCSDITSATVETKVLNAKVLGGVEAWVNSIEPNEISVIIE